MALLQRGLRGEPVRRLQAALGVDADGIFGPGTEKALRAYQSENGLAVDGIAGPDTFAHLGLHELILLRKGVKGEQVRLLQEALGVGADGIFGSGTEAAVREFQESNGLTVDGLAGPATLAMIDQFDAISEEQVAASQLPEDYQEPEVAEAEPEAEAPDPDAGKITWETVEKAPKGNLWSTIAGAIG